MRKWFLYSLLTLSLIFLCFGCSKTSENQSDAATENVPASASQATSEPTPAPTATPAPILKPTRILATTQCIIKFYDNGEFGYIGNLFSNSLVDAYQQWSNEDSIKADMIEAGIPIILEDWELGNYSQNGEKPKFAYVLKSELDQADYNSKYGDQLNEIKSKYKVKQADTITATIDIQSSSWNTAYLVNTDKQGGIVFAEMQYMSEKLMRSLNYCVYDPFDGVQVTDIALGSSHVVGLTKDGKVLGYLAQSNFAKDLKQTDTAGWEDIVDVAAGSYHTIGLKSDGTVLACGDNRDKQCDLSDWKDIIAVEATGTYSFGLKSDGTVVSAGRSQYFTFDVSNWTDILELKVGTGIVAGLRRDGTVLISGGLSYQDFQWDTSRGAILDDIVSINLIGGMYRNSALIALNSKGEIFIVNIYDYFMNYDEFKTGIDDIAATGEDSFAVLKGDQILYSASTSKTCSWDNILKNEARYAYKPFEGNTKVSITDNGELQVNEVLNEKREGIFTYPSKITKACVLGDFGRTFLLLTENGDVLFVEAVDDYQGPMKFESTVLFDSAKEQTKVVKLYQNSLFCAYLDENGNLHYPTFLQERMMEDFDRMNWDVKTNWDRDTDTSSATGQN